MPVSLLAAGASAQSSDSELRQAREVIFAFFAAGNANNWQFVSDTLSDGSRGKSNHSHWMYWAKTLSVEASDVQDILKNGPHGYIPDQEGLYEYFRSRQYEQGWHWRLPEGKESIWSPEDDVYCSYSKWDRVDGGSYRIGALDASPTFLHIFGFDRVEEFGAIVSNKISWVQEIDLGRIVYG